MHKDDMYRNGRPPLPLEVLERLGRNESEREPQRTNETARNMQAPIELGLNRSEELITVTEEYRREEAVDPEKRRKRLRNEADLQASYDRQRGVGGSEAARRYKLICNARQYAESWLPKVDSPRAMLAVTRRIWHQLVPRRLKDEESGFHFIDLHNAVWKEGFPSLEERANMEHEKGRNESSIAQFKSPATGKRDSAMYQTPNPKPASPKLGGRPIAIATEKLHQKWIAMGRPRLTATICDRMANTFFPQEYAKAIRGTKVHKNIRDRIGNAIRRAERRAATKPVS